MTQTRKCENKLCNNPQPKNKWGNYVAYCCKDCMKVSRAEKFKETYLHKDKEAILEKRKKTNTERYGVDNVSKMDAVKDKLRITTAATADIRLAKTKETNLRNYGIESTNSVQSIKDKKKTSLVERYGVDHQLKIPEVAARVAKKNSDNAKVRLAKARETNLERYGCENPSSNLDVQNKRTRTMIERFSVENASQNAEVHERQFKNSLYEYIFESGRIVKYDTSGTIQWQRTMASGSIGDSVEFVTCSTDSSDNIYVSGPSYPGIVLSKYNSSGAVIWKKGLTTGNFSVMGMDSDSAGNTYIAVSTDSTPLGVHVLKYDTTGSQVWQRLVNFSSADWFGFGGITVDSSNVYIVCEFDNNIGGMYTTIKIPADGSILGTSSDITLSVTSDIVETSVSFSENTSTYPSYTPTLPVGSVTLTNTTSNITSTATQIL